MNQPALRLIGGDTRDRISELIELFLNRASENTKVATPCSSMTTSGKTSAARWRRWWQGRCTAASGGGGRLPGVLRGVASAGRGAGQIGDGAKMGAKTTSISSK